METQRSRRELSRAGSVEWKRAIREVIHSSGTHTHTRAPPPSLMGLSSSPSQASLVLSASLRKKRAREIEEGWKGTVRRAQAERQLGGGKKEERKRKGHSGYRSQLSIHTCYCSHPPSLFLYSFHPPPSLLLSIPRSRGLASVSRFQSVCLLMTPLGTDVMLNSCCSALTPPPAPHHISLPLLLFCSYLFSCLCVPHDSRLASFNSIPKSLLFSFSSFTNSLRFPVSGCSCYNS